MDLFVQACTNIVSIQAIWKLSSDLIVSVEVWKEWKYFDVGFGFRNGKRNEMSNEASNSHQSENCFAKTPLRLLPARSLAFCCCCLFGLGHQLNLTAHFTHQFAKKTGNDWRELNSGALQGVEMCFASDIANLLYYFDKATFAKMD